MWRLRQSMLDPKTRHWSGIIAADDGCALSFAEVFALWREEESFRRFWSERLRDEAQFASYCWECPPVTAATLHSHFECVLVESPLLAQSVADPQPFAVQFDRRRDAVSFMSLGGDCLLVAPCPRPGVDAAHLARFIATASAEQAAALWCAVGEALRERVQREPLWLSTAGLGVAWLHVRMDSRPKYYRHGAYKLATA